MNEKNFWDRVKHGCEILDIQTATLHVWKHRGRVSRNQIVPLYQALAGTENEVTLQELQNTHK